MYECVSDWLHVSLSWSLFALLHLKYTTLISRSLARRDFFFLSPIINRLRNSFCFAINLPSFLITLSPTQPCPFSLSRSLVPLPVKQLPAGVRQDPRWPRLVPVSGQERVQTLCEKADTALFYHRKHYLVRLAILSHLCLSKKTRKNCFDVITLRSAERYDQLFLFCQSTVWIGRCEMDVCVCWYVRIHIYLKMWMSVFKSRNWFVFCYSGK